MRRVGRIFYRGLVLLLSLLFLTCNVRLYQTNADLEEDLLPQLKFLKGELHQGAGREAQALFPEGFVFLHSLYGLSWVNVGLSQKSLRQEAIIEASWALSQIETEEGRAPYPPELSPPYGVFYVSWKSWLRGGIFLLQPEGERSAKEVERFFSDCEALQKAFEESETPFLSSYQKAAWPVDSVVGIAVLRLHDRLFAPRYTATIERWKERAQQKLDPKTNLLPHRVSARTGEALDTGRGSSQALLLRFLREIDPVWGEEQYQKFRAQFVATELGLPGVREYPAGVEREGDIDSGPLLFGISASASVVALGTAKLYGDTPLEEALSQTIEGFGFSVSVWGEKRYGLGLLPIGDAFLVWSKTAHPWLAEEKAGTFSPVVSFGWRLGAHLFSILCIFLLILPVVFRRKK